MSSRMLLSNAVVEWRSRMLLQVDLLFERRSVLQDVLLACSIDSSFVVFLQCSSPTSLLFVKQVVPSMSFRPFRMIKFFLTIRCSHSKSHFNHASASRAEQIPRLRRPVASAQEYSAVPCSPSGFLMQCQTGPPCPYLESAPWCPAAGFAVY